MATAPQSPPVLLVGSVPLGTSDNVMTQAAAAVGPHLAQIPDGETGARSAGWLRWLLPVFVAHPLLEPTDETDPNRTHYAEGEVSYLRPKPGVGPQDITFGPLGYAKAAAESYEIFTRLRADGAIRPETRFQVAIPTPLAFVGRFISADRQLDVLPGFEAAILRELAEICDAVPHADLAIQWDVCIEVMMLEEDGKLLISHPVSRYLPAFEKTTVAVSPVTTSTRSISPPNCSATIWASIVLVL